VSRADVVLQHACECLQDLVTDGVAEEVVDLLEIVDVGQHQGQRRALLPRVGQLACQAVVEAAAVAQGGERVAHADFLRFGQMRAQVVDLRLRLLEALLQLASLVLHLGVLGEEELDDDTDLVRACRCGQVRSRLRERDGIALAGIQIRAHQLQDRGRLAVELQRGRRQLGFRCRIGHGWP
jgi:hypothetical protein